MSRPPGFDRDKVAAILLEAMDLELPYNSTVMAVMDCSETQARHMIRATREHGHLGVPPHHPAKARLHRGSGIQKTWIVCEDCTVTWPCDKAFPYRPDLQPEPEADSPDEQPARPRRKRNDDGRGGTARSRSRTDD